MDAMTGQGSSDQVVPVRVSLRLCLGLAICWALPGTLVGGYAVARYLAVSPGQLARGSSLWFGSPAVPGAAPPAISFVSFLVLLSAIILLAPLIFAGLTYLRDALRPPTWRWHAAWLGAVAAGAAVEASWIVPSDQQALQNVTPGIVPPWSSLIMFLGHLAVGIAMIAILRAAARAHG